MTMNTKPKGKRREKKMQHDAPKSAAKSNVQRNTQRNIHSSPQSNILSVQGMSLNAAEARRAIILSEIIGPPAAKRRRTR